MAVAVGAADELVGFDVADHFLDGVKVQRLLLAAGDVRQVDKARRKMPFLHVGVGSFAAPDALDEVGMVGDEVRRTAPFLSWLVPRAKDLEADAVAEDQHPLGAIEGGSVLISFLHVRRPIPLLENELPLAGGFAVAGPFEDAVLRVRELLVVVEEELATEARGRLGLPTAPSPQRATSMSCTPSLPMSPTPKSCQNRQIPGSRLDW